MGRIAALVPEFAVKDLPLGRTHDDDDDDECPFPHAPRPFSWVTISTYGTLILWRSNQDSIHLWSPLHSVAGVCVFNLYYPLKYKDHVIYNARRRAGVRLKLSCVGNLKKVQVTGFNYFSNTAYLPIDALV